MIGRLANPTRFLRLAAALMPWCAWSAATLIAVGLYLAFFASPADYQQGEAVRIMYVHVPSAWMAMFAYSFMAIAAAVGLVWRHPLAHIAAREAAPIGACFTAICLITGSLWGKPMWGAWWLWDARLTSELILLFLYLGFIALHASIDDPRRADRAAALLAIVGSVNVPIIYFSVQWWNTLHQGSTIKFSGTTMHIAMQHALLIMLLACWAYAVAVVLARVRSIILERERNTTWIAELAEVRS